MSCTQRFPDNCRHLRCLCPPGRRGSMPCLSGQPTGRPSGGSALGSYLLRPALLRASSFAFSIRHSTNPTGQMEPPLACDDAAKRPSGRHSVKVKLKLEGHSDGQLTSCVWGRRGSRGAHLRVSGVYIGLTFLTPVVAPSPLVRPFAWLQDIQQTQRSAAQQLDGGQKQKQASRKASNQHLSPIPGQLSQVFPASPGKSAARKGMQRAGVQADLPSSAARTP